MIAESYERIHRSNLVGMGIIPLQYKEGETAESLQLTGSETYSIEVPPELTIGQDVDVNVSICSSNILFYIFALRNTDG